MNRERGVALVTALGVILLCLAVALILTALATGNSQTVGNAYQKQQYYDVAESGVDRGLRDMDSSLPQPGASGFIGATPTPPAAPSPGTTQTPLANVPNISYSYSYWYNPSATATSTPDPIAQLGTFGVASHSVSVPAHGAVIWSYTTVGARDVAVEAVVSRFSSGTGSCALCAVQNISVAGNTGCGNGGSCTPPPQGECTSGGVNVKICTDASPLPSSTPTFVPIITGGTYSVAGQCSSPCAYGDGTSTPNPSRIQQNASPGTIAGFVASQATIDQLADAAAWQAIANGTSIRYLDCSSGCSAATLNSNAPSAGQITYVKGNIDTNAWTGNGSTVSYGGLFIAECVSLSGGGNSGNFFSGTTTSSETIAWGTDAQCGQSAISVSGNATWNGGTAYAANGSVTISGTGNKKYLDFYGAVIAATTITLTGNGNFIWESSLSRPILTFGPYAIGSFAQY